MGCRDILWFSINSCFISILLSHHLWRSFYSFIRQWGIRILSVGSDHQSWILVVVKVARGTHHTRFLAIILKIWLFCGRDSIAACLFIDRAFLVKAIAAVAGHCVAQHIVIVHYLIEVALLVQVIDVLRDRYKSIRERPLTSVGFTNWDIHDARLVV